MARKELFGGAISASLPAHYIDASDLRQVPDTQEVFLAPDSDVSIIFEILQLVTEDGAADDAHKAIEFHFASLAHDNDALTSSVASTGDSSGPQDALLIGPKVLEGRQAVAKSNARPDEADDVLILMALWRIPSKNTDLVLTVNCPVKKASVEMPSQGATDARQAFEAFVSTMQVHDYGLFAG